MDIFLFVSVICCQVQISALGRSLVQRSPIERSVSEYDPKTSRLRRSTPTTAVKPEKRKDYDRHIFFSTTSTIPGDYCFLTKRKKWAFHAVASCNISTFAGLLRVQVCWDPGTHRLVNIYRRSEGSYCLHLQGHGLHELLLAYLTLFKNLPADAASRPRTHCRQS